MDSNDVYSNPLISRYASTEMSMIFSPRTRIETWRKLWVALAESEQELGLKITKVQINQMKKGISNIDWEAINKREKECRHDVMAHVYGFGLAAPKAAPIIHLGATSCYVTDNADLIIMREALMLVVNKLAAVIARLGDFAKKYRKMPTLGFTHFQPAQPTTVGKRATLWAQDFLLDLKELEHRIESLPLRGAVGIICMNLNFARPGCIICSDDKGGIAAGLYSGDSAAAEKSIRILRSGGMQVDYTREAAKEIKWSKMLLNISSNVLNAITGESYKKILSNRFYGGLAVDALKETLEVMKREGIEPMALPGYDVDALAKLCRAPKFITRKIMQKMADDSEDTVTSMQQDLKKVKNSSINSARTLSTEIDELNGRIVALGRKYSIPTPANKRLCEMLQEHIISR